MLDIIGKYDGWLIIKCGGGHYHQSVLYSSGCFACEHYDWSSYYDYLDTTKLIEITDKDIIEQIGK